MKLYAHPMSCSLAPHVSLLQVGVRFELVWVDFDKRTEGGRDYYSIASKGQYPVLQFGDGAILTELAAILQWIADQAPHSGLAPAHGSMERARLQEWLCYIGTEIHKQVFWTYFNADKQSDVPADSRRRRAESPIHQVRPDS
jgi:glutathione S-transferase